MNIQPAQVIIVGGGAVGLGLALLLDRLVSDTGLGLPVVWMTKHKEDGSAAPAVSRWYSLNPGSVAWLQQQGVVLDALNRFESMEVADLVSGSGFVYRAADFGVDALGYTIEETRLLAQMEAQLDSCRHLHRVGQCTAISRNNNQWLCADEQGNSYSADIVFSADGAASKLSAQAGLDKRLAWSNGDVGIICNLRFASKHHAGKARQWFSREGVVALLPMEEAECCSLVWSTHADAANTLDKLHDTAFAEALNQAIAGHAQGCVVEGDRAAYRLGTHYATKLVANGLTLIGNSACTIHPLAGQGLNLGIWQISQLAQCMEQHGITAKALYNWQAAVLPVNYAYWMLMRQLAGIFRSTHPLPVILRNQLLRRLFSHRLIASMVSNFAMYGAPPQRLF